MGKKSIISIILVLLGVGLMAYDLLHGIFFAAEGEGMLDELGWMILVDLRLPRVVTALLAGISLSISGLLMQTLFRNPMAGPYTLGVSSGASLGVALVTMLGLGAIGSIAIVGAIGSVAILLVVLAVARKVRNNTSMLIIGLMLGSIAGALVNLIQNFANPDALKLFITWTFGSLSSVGWDEMKILGPTIGIGFLLSLGLIRPLNGMALGENYARGLGINVERVRVLIVLVTGIMAGAITAYCGPIAFIGVAVPHIARGLYRTADHRVILPASALIGAVLLVACDILSLIPTQPLPISTVSALFGAPVIIWIIMR